MRDGTGAGDGSSFGPGAPRDPEKMRKSFYIMRGKAVAGSPCPDGGGVQYIYLDDGRMVSSAGIVGGIRDQEMLELLKTADGFRRLVHSIGVTVEGSDRERTVEFVFQMYGRTDRYQTGTVLRLPVRCNGMEHILKLEEADWSADDGVPGQIRFVFARANEQATVSVRLYLQDGFDAPEPQEEFPVDWTGPYYQRMLENSLVQAGNPARLQKAFARARRGEDVTVAFIGGSITQGAGAIPIHTECYAWKAFEALCGLTGRGTRENLHYCKAGVGGTPSELGMIRYERDVLADGAVQPDIVVVEFAVNDEGDETKGECYDSLVRKILRAQNRPAVILLFAVFADDFNLQERLDVVGKAYDLPMVSVRDAVVEQFYQKPGAGRVISKSQFFYDRYHPSNAGHTVMADALAHLFRVVDAMPEAEDTLILERTAPPLGRAFEEVRLLDRSRNEIGAKIDCGDFSETDEELQGVERNLDLTQTKQFPYNWRYRRQSGAPFRMEIACTSLLLVFKDSGSARAGCAQLCVDGEPVLTLDPKKNGWTHCNAVICFRELERKKRRVEIRMLPGEEDKEFTILGFGYVEE